MNNFVRILEIELAGFKNVKHGIVQMPCKTRLDCFAPTGDMLGIYGQNGSGKTAIIEALSFVQCLLTGTPLPRETEQYIAKDEERAELTVRFAVQEGDVCAIVSYCAQLVRIAESDFTLARESISCKYKTGTTYTANKKLLESTAYGTKTPLLPKAQYNALLRANADNALDLAVAKRIAEKERTSFLFSAETDAIFAAAHQQAPLPYYSLLCALREYATFHLFILSNAQSQRSRARLVLPAAFQQESPLRSVSPTFSIRLDEPTLLTNAEFETANALISNMNTVLSTIIAGLSVSIHDFGEQLLENREVGHKIELLSQRDAITIPLKYESEGIIKIISILNILLCVYNNPTMCLVLDELDAGIYEYLLGELLLVFEKGAQGQLIFTSHNLRVLELLHYNNLIFSTANPDNRYIRVQNRMGNNNLRNVYLRSILLGGQKEELYTQTDSIQISRAFRRFGKVVNPDA